MQETVSICWRRQR